MANYLKAWRESRSLTQEALGALTNTGKTQISKLEAGKRQLTENWLRRIGDALGVPPSALLHPPEAADHPPANIDLARIVPGNELVGERDLPVYGSAQGGPSGMMVDSTPIEWVKRPEPLMKVKGGFGVYVVDESMEPAFRQGDMLLVHPSLPPYRGADVVLAHHALDGAVSALVKHLTGWTDRDWRVRQYNPPKDYTLARAQWQAVHVIVGKYNGRR